MTRAPSRCSVGRRQKFVFFIVQDLGPSVLQLLGKGAWSAAEKAAAGDGPLNQIAAVQDRLALQKRNVAPGIERGVRQQVVTLRLE